MFLVFFLFVRIFLCFLYIIPVIFNYVIPAAYVTISNYSLNTEEIKRVAIPFFLAA